MTPAASINQQDRRDFVGLATIAEHLRDARAAGDRQLVAEGRMAEEVAADRLRIASALAANWRRVADIAPPQAETASPTEILAMLEKVLPAAVARRDRAYQALVNHAPQYRHYELAELWALSNRIGAFSEGVQQDIEDYVRPRLNAESIDAGVAAMLWWQQRTGCGSIHWLIDTTIALREQARSSSIASVAEAA
ncbi:MULTISPECIES: hypothetical protein [unclassified Sphingomonas]|uniref:hypothetical protein n=1 Tax=unclassified Sphingomonas TaxID=196159 RepID=UPI00226A35CF|nr:MULTISPECIES: hypothetical protein [unclassified Sphingomonas]